MPLSEYEETQFKNLTEAFTLDEPATQTKVENKASSKFKRSKILLIMGCIAIVASVVGQMTDNLLLLSLGGVSALGLFMAAYVREEEETYMERSKR